MDSLQQFMGAGTIDLVDQLKIGIGRNIYGFAPTRRQFCRHLTVVLPLYKSFDDAAARAFMQDTLDIDLEAIEPPVAETGDTLTTDEEAFWTTALAIGKSLLQSGGIPSFDQSAIVTRRLDKARNTCTVTATVPAVENIPVVLYVRNYNHAFRLAAEFAKPQGHRAPVQSIVDRLHEELIKPTRAIGDGRVIDIFCLKEAFDRGIQFDCHGNSLYRLGQGVFGKLISRSATDGDPFVSARVANDKAKTLKFLARGGVPIPKSILVRNLDGAQKAAEEIGFPVVMKPADRDRSEGVTLDVTNTAEVEKGFEAASEWSGRILVEEQVPGICHRLVTFQNRFVFSFARHPKAVVGDGETTIAGLVADANATRDKRAKHLKSKPFLLDDRALVCLREQGLDSNSVPEKDRIVMLRNHNTKDDGGHNEETTEVMHPANRELAERISRMFRFESMGLDLMATDVTQPWHVTGARVTEVNYTPQIGANSAQKYIDGMFGATKGRIPIHCVVGDDVAWTGALETRNRLQVSGLNAFLTSRDRTLGVDGAEVALRTKSSLFERVQALLSDVQVEALVLVVQDDEFETSGMPMIHVTSVDVVNRTLTSFRDRKQSLREEDVDNLVETIRSRIESET